MKGHILVNLSGKDSKLKTWFDQQKDSNISRIVLSAVIYYELTGEYMNIGRLSTVDANLPDSRKIIYIPKQGKAREILEEWEKIDKRVSTKIKRILNMGVLIEPDLNTNYLINEDEAIETVEKILRSVNKGAYIKPAISGNIEPLLNSKSLYTCLSCFACVERCPRGVEPAKIVEATRLAVIREQGANHLKPQDIPEILDDDLPQQAIVSAFRKYTK